jgi:hypothetical protein
LATDALRITIDIFSGRENPKIEFKEDEAKAVLERLRPGRKLGRKKALPSTPTLGYRGLVIDQIGAPVKGLPKTFRYAHGDMFGPGLAHRAEDETFEDFVCGSDRVRKLGKNFPEAIKREVERFRELREKIVVGKSKWPPPYNPCKCAPIYEPEWWNVPAIQPNNNCYNYATNYRTEPRAQPGRAAGAMYTSLTCSSVKAAAVKDDLIDSPASGNACPAKGHLVALVIWPNGDYHWYRKGQNGYWSHKIGSSPVTNLDNSLALIPDPRTADRGPYTDFCGFMVVKHGHIKIK